ncbi:site-specific DNA recombinase [Streptacidiphilus sp. MAP12-20]|uniref:recombinase family protein n=1 Tax=Streptacidiphilus sp. MAP12-20 TaxID=3156299 RepID=UPI0035171EC2
MDVLVEPGPGRLAGGESGPGSSVAGYGALYCRVPHRRSPNQSGVDLREAACRALAAEQGVHIAPRHIFIDHQAASWSKDRRRDAWQAMVRTVETARLSHLLLFDARELQRFQPWDLQQLLTLADQHGLVLLEPAGEWELNAPAARGSLLEETEALCRRRQNSSRSARTAQRAAADQGRPHGGGRRAYGYTLGTYELVPAEAAVVREIFDRYLAGDSLRSIAWSLNERGALTAYAALWSPSRVARILDAPRYAGILVTGSEPARTADGSYRFGDWTPCVSVADWEAVQALRQRHAEQADQERRPSRYYPLTGLVCCTRCERSMVGSMVVNFPTYACAGSSLPAPHSCSRHISAARLEEHVDEWIVTLLERLGTGVDAAAVSVSVLSRESAKRRALAEASLHELTDMNGSSGQRRKALIAQIRAENQDITVRAADALDDVVTGKRARQAWRRTSRARRDEVRRFLISQIRVGPLAGPRGVFDPSRVEIVPNSL